MKRSNNKHFFNITRQCSLVTLIFLVVVTIGFSAFYSSLYINDANMKVRIQQDIRITNNTISNLSSGAISEYEEYNVNNITGFVSLPNSDSTVTYEVEVTNFGNVKEGIYSISEIYKLGGLNTSSNLEIKNTSLNLKSSLCDNSNSSQCTLGSISTFTVTIGYKSGSYNGSDTEYSIELDFDFRRAYDITYIDFSSTSGLPNEMLYGDTLNITFTSVNGIPNSVTTTGAVGSYVSPTLTLTNVSDNISITGVFGPGGSGTFDDPYVYPDTDTFDPSYIADGTTYIFPNVPGSPKATKDEDGNVTYFGYTSTSSTDPVIITNTTDNINTGIVGLNGEKFTIHLVFNANLANNTNKFMVAALEQSGTTYSGFSIYDYNNGYVRVGSYNNRPRSTSTGLLTPNSYANANNTSITGMTTFDITVTYDPLGNNNRFAQIDVSMTVNGNTRTGNIKNNNGSNNIPETLNNATITLGGNGIDNSEDMVYMEVLEFTVTKG